VGSAAGARTRFSDLAVGLLPVLGAMVPRIGGLWVFCLGILSLWVVPASGTVFDYPPILGDRKVELTWQPDSSGAVSDPYYTGNTILRRDALYTLIHQTSRRVRAIQVDSRAVNAYSYAENEAEVNVWRIADGAVSNRLPLGDLDGPVSLSLHPTDTRLLAALPSGEVAIWDLVHGGQRRTFPAGDQPLLYALFYPSVRDTSKLGFVTVGQDDSVRVWDGPGRQRYSLSAQRFSGSSDHASGALALGTDRLPLVAAGTDSGFVRVWDLPATRPESPWRILGPFPGAITSLSFSPDQRLLAASDVSGQVRVWNVVEGILINTIETGQAGPRVEFSRPAGKLLFVGLADGSLELRTGSDARLLRRENLVNQTLSSMVSSADGSQVIMGDANGQVTLLRAGICRPSASEPRCFGGYKVWRSEVPDEDDASVKLLRVYTYNDPNSGDSTWTFVGRERRFADPESIIVRTSPTVPSEQIDHQEEIRLAGPHNGIPYFYSITRFDLVYLKGGVFEVLENSIQDGFYRDRNLVLPTPLVAEAPARTEFPELSSVIVVPNPYERGKVPWESASEPHVEFRNLPEKAKIRVFTVGGDFVREIQHDAGKYGELSDTARWNLRNAADKMVTSGVYIYRIETQAGNNRPGESIQGYFIVVM
jgi:hypothetical protein